MLATQNGRSKPVRTSCRRWLKLMRTPAWVHGNSLLDSRRPPAKRAAEMIADAVKLKSLCFSGLVGPGCSGFGYVAQDFRVGAVRAFEDVGGHIRGFHGG